MFDPAQSNDPLQVPQNEPVSIGDSNLSAAASAADIEKIANTIEEDLEKVPANSTNGAVDESQKTSDVQPGAITPITDLIQPPGEAATQISQVQSAGQFSPDSQQQVQSEQISDTSQMPQQDQSAQPEQVVEIEQTFQPNQDVASDQPQQIQYDKVADPNLVPTRPSEISLASDGTVSGDGQTMPQGIDPNKNYSNVIEVLKDQGALSQEQANQILVENVSTGKSYIAILESKDFVNEQDLVMAKSIVHKIPFIKISETGTDPQALTKIPEGVARNYEMLPISYDKDTNSMVVAMRNPLDLSAIDFAEQKSGLKITAKYALPSELDRKIAENYSQSLSSEVTAALEQTTQVAEDRQRKQNLQSLSGQTIRQAPITKIVQTIVSFAMKARASDVHIEPQESRTRVRYRIDGILVEKLILPKSVHEAVVSRVKILSGLKIDEKRIPQDGRFNFVSGDKEVDLRVSTLPTVNGEKVVMRLLKKDAEVPALEELGLTGVALRHVKDAIKVPHGIILVTGPTGSGKTTTLYSILHTINTPKVNIMTLEDPVEYQMTSVNQVQVNQQAGLTFASGLRSFLRQDPNVIMVGEIRDNETADLAVQASLTGHLVFSTLHTSSAAGAIPRLLDMGVEPFLLASSLTLAMAQRVVRKINPDFKEEYKPEPAVLEDIKNVLGPRLDEWLKKNNKSMENIVLYRAKEGRPATEPEYKGRIAIFEVMNVSENISKMILERRPAIDMERVAINDGMLLMKQDGYLKALDGITTIEEVLRVAEI